MAKSTTGAPLRFLNHVGDAPTYFVPDTGAPGATARLSGPSGDATISDSVKAPGHPERTVDKGEGRPETLPAVGDRVGVQLPRLVEPGVYVLAVEQDGAETVYEITVLAPVAPLNQDDPADLARFVADQNRYFAEAGAWKEG